MDITYFLEPVQKIKGRRKYMPLWIIFLFSIEIGFADGDLWSSHSDNLYETEYLYGMRGLYTEIETGILLFDHIYAKGSIYTQEDIYNWNQYVPYQDIYTFRCGITFEGFDIFYEHTCFHPVYSSSSNQFYLNGMTEKIGIKFSGTSIGGRK